MNKPRKQLIEITQKDPLTNFIDLIKKIVIEESKVQAIKKSFSSFFETESKEIVNEKLSLFTQLWTKLFEVQKSLLKKTNSTTEENLIKTSFEKVFYNSLQNAEKIFKLHKPSEFLTVLTHISSFQLKKHLPSYKETFLVFDKDILEIIVDNSEAPQDEKIVNLNNNERTKKINTIILENDSIQSCVSELLKNLSTSQIYDKERISNYINKIEKIIKFACLLIKNEIELKQFLDFYLQIIKQIIFKDAKFINRKNLEIGHKLIILIQNTIRNADLSKITTPEGETIESQQLSGIFAKILEEKDDIEKIGSETENKTAFVNQLGEIIEGSKMPSESPKVEPEQAEQAGIQETPETSKESEISQEIPIIKSAIEEELEQSQNKLNSFLKNRFAEIQALESSLELDKSHLSTLSPKTIQREELEVEKEEILQNSSEISLVDLVLEISSEDEAEILFTKISNDTKQEIEELKTSMIRNIQNNNFSDSSKDLLAIQTLANNLEKATNIFEKIKIYLKNLEEATKQEKINDEFETLSKTILENEIQLKELKQKLLQLLEKLNTLLQ